MSTTVVITDTSVLINFLVIDRLDLFTQIPGRRFVVTEHVRVEITEHFEEQKLRLESAFEANILNEIRVEDFHFKVFPSESEPQMTLTYRYSAMSRNTAFTTIKLPRDAVDRSHDETADLASRVFELSQTLEEKWVTSDCFEKRRILEIVF